MIRPVCKTEHSGILERGSMPVCPPERRDLSRVSEIKFYNGDQEMCWPPVNWRTLTAGQRLLAREYAAMFLENKGKIQALTSIRRQLLVDKYMFLMLDGEGRPQDEEDENAKVEGKIRQYNLAYINRLQRGKLRIAKLRKK
ncbi:hypothetical protein DPMN_112764 [Dreissena polymorpha]|uniref:Uncharacterized protein n=1 Tax=Dreissena polymorpha TaxID=45954 RepID=A0A9D4KHQ5_DREPO|nr:hypothetical protein DPMN_112764 [Dreissena polymorpha]